MAETIKIARGLNIRMTGEAKKTVTDYHTKEYAVKPTDFLGVFPKLMVKEGDHVKAGTPLFHDKYRENLLFAAPVSGQVREIKRGEKRVLEAIIIEADPVPEFEDFGKSEPTGLTRAGIIEKLLASGLWPMVRQRPYSVIANPQDQPKAIFVSGFDSSPLATDVAFAIGDRVAAFRTGMDILARLTDGKIHLGLPEGRNELGGIKGVETSFYSGPHPAGNVGIQIHKKNPVNKGDIVWTVNPQDVVSIGKLFTEGKYDSELVIALAGSSVQEPMYFRTRKGACIKDLVKGRVKDSNVRYISGNVLTGTRMRQDGYLGYYHHQLTVIPEGNYHEFFGWALPGLNKFSFSKTFFSWLSPGRNYTFDTNFHGGHRALVMTGQYEQVLPMDILPMQLIKACIIEDIDLMEKLGIYEVDEEDFALVEFIDTSKTEIQKIIRQGLDLVRKEMS